MIKENRVDVEEVQCCLEELGDSVDSHKQVEEALGNLLFLSPFLPLIAYRQCGNMLISSWF